jgi:hypothetical protein
MRTQAIRRGSGAAVVGVACVAAAFAGPAAADQPLGEPPRCEQGQANAWQNDPSGGFFHAGKLFACFLGEAPATDPASSFGPAPRCENGQEHAWENDPKGGLSHGGKLFACFVGEPPGNFGP